MECTASDIFENGSANLPVDLKGTSFGVESAEPGSREQRKIPADVTSCVCDSGIYSTSVCRFFFEGPLFCNMAPIVTFALTSLMLTCLVTRVVGMEVYLRKLKVYTSHESSFMSNSPEVYLICKDDRDPMMLREVVEINKLYEFGAEQMPATHVEDDECVVCTLMEFDLLDSDDEFGQMKICAKNFKNGASVVHAKGEFYAYFECPMCKLRHEEAKRSQVVENVKDVRHESQSYVHTNAIAVGEAGAPAHCSGKEGMSTGGMVLISLTVFFMGAVIGAVVMKFYTSQKKKLEAARVHELNAVFSRTDVPFESIPKGTTKQAVAQKSGVAAYHQIPTEDARDTI